MILEAFPLLECLVVAFFSCARLLGEKFYDSFPCLFFLVFLLQVEISSHTPVPLFRPGSVHSGSTSWLFTSIKPWWIEIMWTAILAGPTVGLVACSFMPSHLWRSYQGQTNSIVLSQALSGSPFITWVTLLGGWERTKVDEPERQKSGQQIKHTKLYSDLPQT